MVCVLLLFVVYAAFVSVLALPVNKVQKRQSPFQSGLRSGFYPIGSPYDSFSGALYPSFPSYNFYPQFHQYPQFPQHTQYFQNPQYARPYSQFYSSLSPVAFNSYAVSRKPSSIEERQLHIAKSPKVQKSTQGFLPDGSFVSSSSSSQSSSALSKSSSVNTTPLFGSSSDMHPVIEPLNPDMFAHNPYLAPLLQQSGQPTVSSPVTTQKRESSSDGITLTPYLKPSSTSTTKESSE